LIVSRLAGYERSNHQTFQPSKETTVDIDSKGLDPNSATGTRDAIDPETGALGTAGTPVTAGYGASGSTIGTGTPAGEQEQKEGDFAGVTPNTKGYTAGGSASPDSDDTLLEED
jgi:hypothetical protein